MSKMPGDHESMNLQGREVIAEPKRTPQSFHADLLEPTVHGGHPLLGLLDKPLSSNSLCVKVEPVEVLMLQLAEQDDSGRSLDHDQIDVSQQLSRHLGFHVFVEVELRECLPEN